MSARRAIVLGGGVAGITAAFTLRDRGYAVELIEAHRHLGGRAFTLPQRDGEPAIDNGPHVILGCYDEFRGLLRRIGSESHFRRASRLELGYRDASGRSCRLRLLPGPVPLTFPLALLGLRGLSFGERLRALRGLIASLRIPKDGCTFAAWLARKGQDGAPRRYLWDPMCRSIMNAEAEEIDAALMLSTLEAAFGGSGARAAIWIPSAPWSAIVGEPALARLCEEGVTVQLGARLQSLAIDDHAVRAITFADGSLRSVAADELVVSALPWQVLRGLAPSVGVAPALCGKPMVSVAFFGDRDRGHPRDALIALVDGEPFHFFCRRDGDPPGHFALLSGGARGLEGLSAQEVIAGARAQLRRHFPNADTPDDLPARITKESQATLLPRAGEGALRPRPGPHATIRNLVLCGDWTATGLPSTLEGAARSGRDAVETIWPVRSQRPEAMLGARGALLLGLLVGLFCFVPFWFEPCVEPVLVTTPWIGLVALAPIVALRWFESLDRMVWLVTLPGIGLVLSLLAHFVVPLWLPFSMFTGVETIDERVETLIRSLHLSCLAIALGVLAIAPVFTRLSGRRPLDR
ncbi:MAG: hydroxysqualene dehydroxylase HpnE [Planctomycetota bacterium]